MADFGGNTEDFFIYFSDVVIIYDKILLDHRRLKESCLDFFIFCVFSMLTF